MKCGATTRAGKPCNARPLLGRDRCIMHSAEAIPAQLGSIGGRQRAHSHETTLKFAPPADAEELRSLVANLIVLVTAGEISAKTANAVACLGGLLLKSIDSATIEQRLSAVELLIEQRQQGPRRLA